VREPSLGANRRSSLLLVLLPGGLEVNTREDDDQQVEYLQAYHRWRKTGDTGSPVWTRERMRRSRFEDLVEFLILAAASGGLVFLILSLPL
jgi:hypothetical protein